MTTGRKTVKTVTGFILAGILLCSFGNANAANRDVARRIHDRLVGTPPSAVIDPTLLDQMEALVAAGNANAAAQMAIDQAGNTGFYNSTLKNFFATYTNLDGSVYVPLNDATATMVGMVRDGIAFDRVLYGDVLYTGGNSVSTPYAIDSNQHYQDMEDNGVDLKASLVPASQALLHPMLGVGDVAGVVTTRAFAESYFSNGTNRRMLAAVFDKFMCRTLEEINDVTRTPDRIRQDVSRAPGGDSAIYLGSCVGCHAGMDPLAGAYAYYEWDAQLGQLVFDNTQPQPKNLINNTVFPGGHVTVDNSWLNYWRRGPNSVLGWNQTMPDRGMGAQSMGQELAASRAFAHCQTEKVYEAVCLRKPKNGAERQMVEALTDSFIANGYNMKTLFGDAAAYCATQDVGGL